MPKTRVCQQCGDQFAVDVSSSQQVDRESLCPRCDSDSSPAKTVDPFATVVSCDNRLHDDSDLWTLQANELRGSSDISGAYAGELPTIPGYKILGVLGRGGMGIVYQAVQERASQRLVAVKMIFDQHTQPSDQHARFNVEVNAISSVEHPNIVRIYDVGTVGKRNYFTMEYCSGGTLYDRLKKQLMTAKQSATLIATLARAMEVVHAKRIVHRDLKPLNVLYDARGVPKITDFGLAKEIEMGNVDTASGIVMGTPSYMSPEQASGHGNKATPETDIYALGAILYSCLTGRAPFAGSSVPETLNQIQRDDPISIRRLAPKSPRDLITICEKCMQKTPSRRYQNVADLADDLTRFLEGKPISARPVNSLERLVKAAKRKPMLAAFWTLLGFSCVGAVVAVVLLAVANVRERNLRIQANKYAQDAERAALQLEDFASYLLSDLSENDYWTRYFPLYVGQEGSTPEPREDNRIPPEKLKRLYDKAKSGLAGHPYMLAKVLITLANAMRAKMMFPESLATLDEARLLLDQARETTQVDRIRWQFSKACCLDEVGEISAAYEAFVQLLDSQPAMDNQSELADAKVRLAWVCGNRLSILGSASPEKQSLWSQRGRQELEDAIAIYSNANTPLAQAKKQVCELLLLARDGKVTLNDVSSIYTKLLTIPNREIIVTGVVSYVLAEQLRRAGKHAEAIAKFSELEALASSRFGKNNYLSLLALGALVGAEKSAFERSPDEAFRQKCKLSAIKHINEGLAVGKVLCPKHPYLALGYEALAQLLESDQRLPEATQALLDAQAIAEFHPEDLRPLADRLSTKLQQLEKRTN